MSGDTWRWGTVTQTSPLTVRLDGDAAALSVTPDLIGAVPALGQRVWCQVHERRLVVLGRSGDDTRWMPIALASGFTASTVPPQVRLVGETVFFRGAIAGAFPAGSFVTPIETGGLPSWAWAQTSYRNATFVIATGGLGVAVARIQTTGALVVAAVGSDATEITLAGMSGYARKEGT